MSCFTFLSFTKILFSHVQLIKGGEYDFYGNLHLKLDWGELLKCCLIHTNPAGYTATLFHVETEIICFEAWKYCLIGRNSLSHDEWKCWSSAASGSADGVSSWFCFHIGVNLELCCKANRTATPLVKAGEDSPCTDVGAPDQGEAPRYELGASFCFSSFANQRSG